MSERSGRPRPVVLLAVSQRSGTHYLYDLLLRHPDCRPARSQTTWEGSWEDHLVRFSHALAYYGDRIEESDPRNDERTWALLMESLGGGLERFLREVDGVPGDERRPVTKSPETEHLEYLPALFPGIRPVVLVRDPRATVASALHAFGGPAQRWILNWRDGVRRLLAFEREHPGLAVLVRYEELYRDPAGQLARILTAVGLDPSGYDASGLAELAVRGSSQLGGGRQRVNWHPVAATADFDPIGRGRSLPPDVAERLRWLASAELAALGYLQPEERRPTGVAAAAHRARDLTGRAAGTAAGLAERLSTRRAWFRRA